MEVNGFKVPRVGCRVYAQVWVSQTVPIKHVCIVCPNSISFDSHLNTYSTQEHPIIHSSCRCILATGVKFCKKDQHALPPAKWPVLKKYNVPGEGAGWKWGLGRGAEHLLLDLANSL
jgi:hypothetical protein